MATRSFPITLVLPDLPDAQDACVQRLTTLTTRQPGVSLAHATHDSALCVHFDPSQTTLAEVQQRVTAAGARLSAEYGHVSIAFGGLPGDAAGRRLEHMLRKQAGVLEVSANVAARRVRVEFERSKTDVDTLRRLVEGARFLVEPTGPSAPAPALTRFLTDNRELVWSLTAAVLLGLGWAGERVWAWPDRVTIPLYLAAYAFGAWDLVRHTMASWRRGAFTFDIDLLMLLAALGAAGLGEWAEGAFLLALFALAHALEHYAMDRARGAIRALADLAPAIARVRRDGHDVEIPVEAVKVDEVVVVRFGDRIPVDGVVAGGQSSVNQAPVTGESVPVDKAAGDDVFAGTVNGEGALEVRTTRSG